MYPAAMVVWIDADACPAPVREIVFRAAERVEVEAVFVSNQPMRVPRSRYIRQLQVDSGFDVADARILKELAAGDLVITADIPLAAQVVAAGAFALNPRGTFYTADNVADHLSRRDLLDELRSAGAVRGGPPPLGKADIQAFANGLDRFLTRHVKPPGG